MTFNETTIPVYYRAIRLMFSNQAVKDGMNELDALVRQLLPHPIWDRLRALDFAADLPGLQAWIAETLALHPDGIPVLFFCLSDLGDALTLYFLRPEREPADDSDWEAYDHSLSAEVPSPLLARMFEIGEDELADGKGGFTNDHARWIIETCYPLAYAGLALAQALQSLPPQALLGSDARRRVAVFFGEGDDFFLGEIRAAGFRYAPPPAWIA